MHIHRTNASLSHLPIVCTIRHDDFRLLSRLLPRLFAFVSPVAVVRRVQAKMQSPEFGRRPRYACARPTLQGIGAGLGLVHGTVRCRIGARLDTIAARRRTRTTRIIVIIWWWRRDYKALFPGGRARSIASGTNLCQVQSFCCECCNWRQLEQSPCCHHQQGVATTTRRLGTKSRTSLVASGHSTRNHHHHDNNDSSNNNNHNGTTTATTTNFG